MRRLRGAYQNDGARSDPRDSRDLASSHSDVIGSNPLGCFERISLTERSEPNDLPDLTHDDGRSLGYDRQSHVMRAHLTAKYTDLTRLVRSEPRGSIQPLVALRSQLRDLG